MATPLALVIATCFDLTLLYIDNNYLCSAFGGEMDQLGHILPKIRTESHSSVNVYTLFYLKA